MYDLFAEGDRQWSAEALEATVRGAGSLSRVTLAVCCGSKLIIGNLNQFSSLH
jgi:hypothetical protein